ncbi:MAG: acyltransferase [Desulfobacteraceae bacterium]|nr:acyltransferase [Desulfobacteraceae bacterium]
MNITLRHPCKIKFGNNVVISEGCVLDGRSEENETTLVLEDDVILSNDVIISCKNGFIEIGSRTGINSRSIIQSTNDCSVSIGDDVIVGQMSFIVGGGSYNTDRLDVPIRTQGIKDDGGIVLENDIWVGANVTILGGVTIGGGSIAAAGSLVTKNIPALSVCQGSPAKVVKTRE